MCTFLEAMEDGLVVVALHAQLDEVAAGQRALPAPQLNVQIPKRRVQQHFACTHVHTYTACMHIMGVVPDVGGSWM